MQNVLNHVSDRSSHLTNKRRKFFLNFQHSISGSYYTTLGYDVIRGISKSWSDLVWYVGLTQTKV